MITCGAPSPSRASRRVASIPSITGMRTSISTTSGRSKVQTRTASSPSAAVPTTVKSGCVSSSSAKPALTTPWSSATTTRTGLTRAPAPRPSSAGRPRRESHHPERHRCATCLPPLRPVPPSRRARARRRQRLRPGSVTDPADGGDRPADGGDTVGPGPLSRIRRTRESLS